MRTPNFVLLLSAVTGLLLGDPKPVQLGHVPLYFEPNEGQTHASVRFLSRGVYLAPAKAAIHTGEGMPVVMSLVGARQSVQAEGLDLQPGITSYFIGNDPKKWRSGIPHYAKVQYKGVYPGINVVYYGNAEGQLEYDFVVAPGADPSRIEIAYNRPVRKDGNGDLLIAGLRQKRPKVYQGSQEIAADYRLHDGHVQLGLADYDRSQALTIDPVLQYSTYLGGPGYEGGAAIAVDASGSAYITGYARAPVQPGLDPFQQTVGQNYNAYVIKLAPGGNALAYYVFIGDQDESGNSIAVDATGAAWITGQTRSFGFPTKNPLQAKYGGGFDDAFVTKVSPDGKSLAFSSYLGGPQADIGNGIAVDPTGNAYVGLQTAGSQLPVSTNAYQSSAAGGADAYVLKLSPVGGVIWGTYIGGSSGDWLQHLAVDSSGQAYVVGFTDSTDFPTTKKPFQSSLRTGGAFITKLKSDGTGLIYSTLMGGNSGSQVNRVAVDRAGTAYIAGLAFGPDFPIKSAIQPSYAGGDNDGFVAALTPGGEGIVFSTFLGGSNAEYGCCAIAVGPDNSISIAGHTSSPDFPVKNSLQLFRAGGTLLSGNAFVTQFRPSGDLVFSSILGGSTNDWATGIAVDSSAAIYVIGFTGSTDYPVLNAYQKTNGGLTDIFVTKLVPDAPFQSPFAAVPSVLPVRFVIGGAVPSVQNISITSSPSGQTFTATTDAKWLAVSPASSTTPVTLIVSVNPSGLSAGLYSGTIRINTQTAVQVNLNVLNPAPVVSSVSPSAIPPGSNDTIVTVTGAGFMNGALLQFSGNSVGLPTTFVNATTLQAVVNKGLAAVAATYTLVVVNPQSAPSQPLQVTIGTPIPAISALTNAASYATGGVAPGEIISVFGTGLGPLAGVPLSLTPTGVVGTSLSGVQFLFDGIPAPLIYVRADQVSAIVPYAIGDGRPNTHVAVQYNGQTSAVFTLPVAGSAPALFTADASGRGQGAILNEDGSVNSLSNPAAKGSVVVLYGTGEGATNPPGVDGKLADDVLPKPTLPVTVSVDGKDAQVLYAGAAPGEVAGVIQVNVRLPNGVNSGPVPVGLQVGGASSQSGIVLSVQ